MTTDRLDHGELQAAREYLGLTTQDLATALGVRHDTLRRWESGRDPIPLRVRDELGHLQRGAAGQVAALVNDLTLNPEAVAHVYRTNEALHAAQPTSYPMPARWWRHIVMRAVDQVDRDVEVRTEPN